MRIRVYTYFLLLIWTIVVAKPLLAYAQYAVFKSYIAKNICVQKTEPKNCCKGKCYLNQQLAQSTDKQQTNEPNTQKKGPQHDIKEFISNEKSNALHFPETQPRVAEVEKCLSNGIDHLVFVPPKA